MRRGLVGIGTLSPCNGQLHQDTRPQEEALGLEFRCSSVHQSSILDGSGSDRWKRLHAAPSSAIFRRRFDRADPFSGPPLFSRFSSLDIRFFLSFFLSFFLFPIFFAHRSGSSSPLRPTRLLLSRFHPHWVPPKADACLRLHAPRSLVPQRKRGREKGKNKMSYLYVKWNRFGLRFARRRFRHESMVCLALAPPVAKTCDAGGGALRS
jgi:hypothetical protein